MATDATTDVRAATTPTHKLNSMLQNSYNGFLTENLILQITYMYKNGMLQNRNGGS